MRVVITALIVGLNVASFAQEDSVTALGALKLLPKAQAKNIAHIEARDGSPNPERWHILVHDPAEQNGLREFVVAKREVVASRSISQFADEIKPEEVIGNDVIKIDSDRAVKIAQQFAKANNFKIVRVNYELKKDGDGSIPIWKITCFDANGETQAEVSVTATKGSVLSHEGFAVTPDEGKKRTATTAQVEPPIAEGERAGQPQTTVSERTVVVRRGVQVAPPPPAEPPRRFRSPLQRLFSRD